jgi:hypothetical protein
MPSSAFLGLASERNAVKIITLAWIFAASILAAGKATADTPVSRTATATVRAGGIELKAADLVMKIKPGHAYMMWDAFPSKEALKKAGGHGTLANVVKDLLKGPLAGKFPEARKAIVDVVEFTGRDEYGMPRWDTLVKLARYEGTRGSGKAWTLKEEK